MKENQPLIMIVDDVPKNLQVLGSVLSKEKYQIAAAINGRQALMLLENIRPDLILLDVMMPEMNGFEVCRKLKRNNDTKEIPVVFLTARTETEDIVEGFEAGAVDYVLKPFNATELLARVDTHLSLKQARDRLKELVARLEQRTAALEIANHQLRERQNLIVNLLADISKIKLSGDRHAIRNFSQRILEREKNSLVRFMSAQIRMIRRLIMAHPDDYGFFKAALSSFGLNDEAAAHAEPAENHLHRVVIEGGGVEEFEGDENDELEADDLLADIFSEEIYLDQSYEQYRNLHRKYIESAENPLIAEFDPFVLFYSVKSVQDLVSEINVRFANYGNIGFLDRIQLSEAVNTAWKYATAEKEKEFEIDMDLAYDPEFNTNKESLVYMIRDLFYNAVDAGANRVRIVSRRPSQEDEPPHFNEFEFEDYPSLYLEIEDNGKGVSAEKAAQLNAYLSGDGGDETRLSTKGNDKGGLGAKNLRDFLYLHKGRCFYEPGRFGTIIHFYLERLEI